MITRALLDRAAELRVTPTYGLKGLIADYKKSPEFQRLSDSTQRDYRRTLDRIDEKFGRARLGAFEDRRMRGDIIAWRDEWRDKPRTADKLTVMLGTLLEWGLQRGRLRINVAHNIPLLHSADKSDEIWERRHIRAMVGAPAQLRDALKIAAFTGLRLGDLVRLDWSHVHDKSIVIVTKKRKGRAVIPITSTLRRLLDRREWRTGTILRNSRGKPWTESGLGSVFQKHKPEGFDRTIHDLRGTYVTWLATMGLTDEEIARIIGWTAQRIGAIRARYVDEQRVIVSLVERLAAVKSV
ncbi:tyrosine-type recombinase/integrase [Sphingopyxis indica]|uniref:tyrosine-type recombinase/integrase n=1 Tax=Sphingopyxis indica TaxID=436663 RepID=UPI0029390FEC|nr:tyrosine-type recombinase/integrase [Sphingopyxis indica]WOF44266.1 tyrosine-type recombinase/integrase [Sphingopyxis indica]